MSKNRAQLFEVNDDKILPRGVDGMPASMEDVWKGMERQEQTIQFHSTGNRTAGFHGQGGAKDVEEQEEDQYARALAKSIEVILKQERLPLVFVGVTEEYGMFKKFDQSGALVDEYIRGNPDQMQMEDLKEKADPIAQAHIMKMNEVHLEEYGNLQGTGRTSTDAAVIEESAKNGKVDLLLVAEGSQDAAKYISEHVKEHRGRTLVVNAAKMPEGAKMAAVLRF